MTTEEILTEYPHLTKDQIVKYEPAAADTRIDLSLTCPHLTFVRNEGNFSIYQATAFVTVRVNSIKPDGSWNGSTWVAMKPGDTFRFRMNTGSGNYDGWSC